MRNLYLLIIVSAIFSPMSQASSILSKSDSCLELDGGYGKYSTFIEKKCKNFIKKYENDKIFQRINEETLLKSYITKVFRNNVNATNEYVYGKMRRAYLSLLTIEFREYYQHFVYVILGEEGLLLKEYINELNKSLNFNKSVYSILSNRLLKGYNITNKDILADLIKLYLEIKVIISEDDEKIDYKNSEEYIVLSDFANSVYTSFQKDIFEQILKENPDLDEVSDE